MHQPHLLLVGFGDLNQQVAAQLADRFRITAVSRSPKPGASVPHLAIDLINGSLDTLPDKVDYLVYCVTPSSYDEKGYRDIFVHAWKRLLDHYLKQPPKHLFMVSSTSVYAQDDDAVVDEASPTEPAQFSGKALLEGEALLKAYPAPGTVVRFSGIYGAHRTRLLEQIIAGQKSPRGPSAYTNRIHQSDAVAALVHLVERAAAGNQLDDCYLASDDEPVRMHEVVDWVRQQTHCAEVDSKTQISRRAGSKQCSNRRLRNTGFSLTYPTFREGYGAMLRDREKSS